MDTHPLPAHPLTYVRHRHGWSMSDVAAIVARRSRLNMAQGKQKVWRWEHGKAVPEMAAQLALAAELDIDPAHVTAYPWPAWLRLAHGIDVTLPWGPRQALDTLLGALDAAADPRSLRSSLSGEAVGALADAWASAPAEQIVGGASGGRIGAEVAAWAESQLPYLWRLDDLVGGEHCLDLAAADLRLVTRLLARGKYAGTVERRLYRVAAELCRFAGWCAFDGGRHTAAERYWHAGLRAAATADDVGTGVYILSQMAMQRTYGGDGRGAVALLEVARERNGTRTSRTVQSMLDAWQVRAHAVAGEVGQAGRLLYRADEHWARRSPEDDPSWIYWMRRPSSTIEVGMAFVTLGRPRTAEKMLASGMAERTADYGRDRMLNFTALASARLARGDLDGALDAARQAAATAETIGSVRVSTELRAFTKALPPDPEAHHFREELREIPC